MLFDDVCDDDDVALCAGVLRMRVAYEEIGMVGYAFEQKWSLGQRMEGENMREKREVIRISP